MAWVTYPAVSELTRNAGFLFWNPSALTSEATWGTKLGYTDQGVDVLPSIQVAELTEEETGNEVTRIVKLGETPRIVANLSSWNATSIARAFPSMTSTTNVSHPGSNKPGAFLQNTTGVLLFVPDDVTNNLCLIVYKACPRLVQEAVVKLSHGNLTMLMVSFLALRSNGSGTSFYLGKMSGAPAL